MQERAHQSKPTSYFSTLSAIRAVGAAVKLQNGPVLQVYALSEYGLMCQAQSVIERPPVQTGAWALAVSVTVPKAAMVKVKIAVRESMSKVEYSGSCRSKRTAILWLIKAVGSRDLLSTARNTTDMSRRTRRRDLGRPPYDSSKYKLSCGVHICL